MNDELLFERLASHDGPASPDTAFEDRLYLVLQREMRGGHSLQPALLLAATLAVVLTLTAAIAVGSGLIEAPWLSPSLVPAPSQPASAAPIPVLGTGADVSGRYFIYGGGVAYDWFGLDITASVPRGWHRGNLDRGGFGIVRGAPPVMLSFWVVDNLMADPCPGTYPSGATEFDPPVGSSVADLAAALASLPTVAATIPENVRLGGWSGMRIDLRIRDDLACEALEIWTWYETPSRGDPFSMYGHPGVDHRVWILDVDGFRLVIDAATSSGARPGIQSELQSIVDSIDIEPRR